MEYSIELPLSIYTKTAIDLTLHAYQDYVIVKMNYIDNSVALDLTVNAEYSANQVEIIHGLMNHLLSQSAIDILSGDI